MPKKAGVVHVAGKAIRRGSVALNWLTALLVNDTPLLGRLAVNDSPLLIHVGMDDPPAVDGQSVARSSHDPLFVDRSALGVIVSDLLGTGGGFVKWDQRNCGERKEKANGGLHRKNRG